jgi:ATP-dependent DNA ligase
VRCEHRGFGELARAAAPEIAGTGTGLRRCLSGDENLTPAAASERGGRLFKWAYVAKRAKSRGIPAEGAKPAAMPGFIKPQLATLKAKAPSGEQWLNEIKYDGYRVQLHASGGRATAYTRNGLDWTKRFAGIAKAFGIPRHSIVDGEAVVIEDGRTNFSKLQAALAASNSRAASSTTPSTCSTSTDTTCAPTRRSSASGC